MSVHVRPIITVCMRPEDHSFDFNRSIQIAFIPLFLSLAHTSLSNPSTCMFVRPSIFLIGRSIRFSLVRLISETDRIWWHHFHLCSPRSVDPRSLDFSLFKSLLLSSLNYRFACSNKITAREREQLCSLWRWGMYNWTDQSWSNAHWLCKERKLTNALSDQISFIHSFEARD